MDPAAVVTPPHAAGPLRLHPFRGLTLAPDRIGDVATGRTFARPYRDVAARLDRLRARGRLHVEETPALYLHEYSSAGITVRGLVGSLDISRRAAGIADAVVLPHEGIHPDQAAELADRMGQMQLNPAPILLVHDGPDAVRGLLRQIRTRPPDRSFVDRGGQQHRIWAMTDLDEQQALSDGLADSRALIADGHHRYAAYLRLQHDHPGPATSRGLAMLVDQGETPLFLGAIHRVLSGVDVAALDALGHLALVRPATAEEAIGALSPDTIVAHDGRRWATLRLELRPGQAAVEVLHRTLLPRLRPRARRVSYQHSVEDALGATARRRALAVLLPAPDFDDVLGAAAAGRLLPEKATSFQPKPHVGVLMRSLRDG